MAVPKYQYIIIYFENGGTVRFDDVILKIPIIESETEIYFKYKIQDVIKEAVFYKRNIAGWIFVPDPDDPVAQRYPT